MNTQEMRETMIEIDAQPTTNPLDVPTPKPSEIVRNWPDAMWGTTFTKKQAADGHVTFCAIGIIQETAGRGWGEPVQHQDGVATWDRYDAVLALGLTDAQISELFRANDWCGKYAAAALLESWGL